LKKDVKSKVAAKKWFNGRLMAKNLITTIQVNLVPNPREGNTELSLLKLPLAYHQAISWPPPWISHLFSQWPSWGLHTFFAVGLDIFYCRILLILLVQRGQDKEVPKESD